MDNDNSSSSNNSGQLSNNPVNQPANQTQERKTTNWRTLSVLLTVILVIILLIGIIYLRLSHPQSVTPTPPPSVSPTISPTSSPTTAKELPPLYSGVQWQSTKSGKLVFRTSQNELIELDGYRTESVLLKTYPQDFIDYYRQELTRMGWTETGVASGPNGESYWYNKNSKYIQFGISLVADTPIQYSAFVEHN